LEKRVQERSQCRLQERGGGVMGRVQGVKDGKGPLSEGGDLNRSRVVLGVERQKRYGDSGGFYGKEKGSVNCGKAEDEKYLTGSSNLCRTKREKGAQGRVGCQEAVPHSPCKGKYAHVRRRGKNRGSLAKKISSVQKKRGDIFHKGPQILRVGFEGKEGWPPFKRKGRGGSFAGVCICYDVTQGTGAFPRYSLKKRKSGEGGITHS